jgi:hypothetical protein
MKNITIVVGGAVDLLQPTRQETLRQPRREQVGQGKIESSTMYYESDYDTGYCNHPVLVKGCQ